ncbi:hypothetical protein DP116_01340 [Brasilonema bromeliae SPC951]|uniref:Uncharacterized protein n=1 Tax=Brasilonema bromeliae SPC951 TaxID=385972 RepID=A0ABX1P2Q0_9CYAN|nr:hypothetical protein [Brasilonema bromeliae SPC951]
MPYRILFDNDQFLTFFLVFAGYSIVRLVYAAFLLRDAFYVTYLLLGRIPLQAKACQAALNACSKGTGFSS